MSRAFTIRTATEADVEQITAIYGYHVLHGTGSFELEAPTVEEMKRRFHHIAERHSPYIVAVREDKPSVVLGYAYAGPFRERKAYDTTVEDSIYVAQAAGTSESDPRFSLNSSTAAATSDTNRWSASSVTAKTSLRSGCTPSSAFP